MIQYQQNPYIPYLVVGGEGNILTSTNGKDWKKIKLGVSNSINSIAYNKSLIIAVGDEGLIIKSDYKNWEIIKKFTNDNFHNLNYN